MSNEQKVVLSADDKEVTIERLKKTYFAVKQLHDWIQRDTLTEEMKEAIPQLVEYNMADISKVIGFDSLSAKKVEEKYAEIRQANEKIRELEEKLGNSNSIDGLKEQLKSLSDLFKHWWRMEGFRYTKEINFTEYGMFEAELGISFHRTYLFSKKPVEKRQLEKDWLEGLKNQGYKLYQNEQGGEKELIDCPENKELLTKLLTERFPSLEIEKWETQSIFHSTERLHEIHSIKVSISDLKDLEALRDYMKKYKDEDDDF